MFTKVTLAITSLTKDRCPTARGVINTCRYWQPTHQTEINILMGFGMGTGPFRAMETTGICLLMIKTKTGF